MIGKGTGQGIHIFIWRHARLLAANRVELDRICFQSYVLPTLRFRRDPRLYAIPLRRGTAIAKRQLVGRSLEPVVRILMSFRLLDECHGTGVSASGDKCDVIASFK